MARTTCYLRCTLTTAAIHSLDNTHVVLPEERNCRQIFAESNLLVAILTNDNSVGINTCWDPHCQWSAPRIFCYDPRQMPTWDEESWPLQERQSFVTVTEQMALFCQHTGHKKLRLLITSETNCHHRQYVINKQCCQCVIFLGNYIAGEVHMCVTWSTRFSIMNYQYGAVNDVRTITAPSFTKEENQFCL